SVRGHEGFDKHQQLGVPVFHPKKQPAVALDSIIRLEAINRLRQEPQLTLRLVPNRRGGEILRQAAYLQQSLRASRGRCRSRWYEHRFDSRLCGRPEYGSVSVGP